MAALLGALLILLGGAAVEVLRIRADLDGGREAISGLAVEDLDQGLVPTIERAAGRLDRASSTARRSPFLRVLGAVPGVRTQVEAVRDMTRVGDDLGEAGIRAAVVIDQVLQQAGGDPSKRVTLLDTVAEQLDVVEDEIGTVRVGAGGPLVLPLADARRELVAALESAPDRLDEARFYLGGLRRLLAGPSSYLLLAANNAEMRGGGGSPLSGGVVTIADGDIQFGEFRQLVGIRIARPADLRAPESWKGTYGNWVYGNSYLETSASPNFAVTGPIYEAMSPAAGFGEVDGVLQVDAIALGNLLSAIGPVELDGTTYDQGNVAQKILNQNYLDFADIGEDRTSRVDLQARLAQAIFDAFKARDVPVAKLAVALQDAAKGRHLIAHSKDPAVQTLWESIGADGSLSPLGLMVAVENVAANKLDWYLDPKVTLNVYEASNGDWAARLSVEITNPEVDETSPQVDGGFYGLDPGDHRTMVAAYLPQHAYNIRTPDNSYSEAGPDPPLHMVAQRVEVPRGETRVVSFAFSMPQEFFGALILPSGRARPVEYEVNGVKVTDAAPIPVLWDDPGADPEDPGAPAAAAGLFLAGSLALLYGVRTRVRLAGVRPLRPVPELAERAPSLGVVLYLAGVGILVAGALISSASGV